MQLIVITENDLLPNETAIINELFSRGLQRLHIRKYSLAVNELSNYIAQIAPQHHSKLVICNHYELLNQYQHGGAHVNSYQRNDATAWDAINKQLPIPLSTSFHLWQEFINADYDYQYAFISPVFDSISKTGYKAAIDLGGANKTKNTLKESNKHCPMIYGLGGVDQHNLKALHEKGFDGAAILGAVWRQKDPIKAFTTINEVINSLPNT